MCPNSVKDMYVHVTKNLCKGVVTGNQGCHVRSRVWCDLIGQ